MAALSLIKTRLPCFRLGQTSQEVPDAFLHHRPGTQAQIAGGLFSRPTRDDRISMDEFATENLLQEANHAMAATVACYSTVRAGNWLTEQETQGVIDQPADEPEPHHLPRGRPTVITIAKYCLEREFRRCRRPHTPRIHPKVASAPKVVERAGRRFRRKPRHLSIALKRLNQLLEAASDGQRDYGEE